MVKINFVLNWLCRLTFKHAIFYYNNFETNNNRLDTVCLYYKLYYYVTKNICFNNEK